MAGASQPPHSQIKSRKCRPLRTSGPIVHLRPAPCGAAPLCAAVRRYVPSARRRRDASGAAMSRRRRNGRPDLVMSGEHNEIGARAAARSVRWMRPLLARPTQTAPTVNHSLGVDASSASVGVGAVVAALGGGAGWRRCCCCGRACCRALPDGHANEPPTRPVAHRWLHPAPGPALGRAARAGPKFVAGQINSHVAAFDGRAGPHGQHRAGRGPLNLMKAS